MSILDGPFLFCKTKTKDCGRRIDTAFIANHQSPNQGLLINARGSNKMSGRPDRRNKASLASQRYHRAREEAQIARAHFLRSMFSAAKTSLKDRICYRAQQWNVRLCPLCC